MSHHTNALRAATAATLVSGFACFGTGAANADPNDTLAANLSKGYSSSNCSPQTPPSGVLAVLQCGQNSDPSGPVFAKYLLFNTSSDLNSSFTTSIGSDTLTNCGDAKSPTTWHQGSSNDPAGQVACGTYQGQAEVIWTTDGKNVMSLIRAANGDTATLYQWWRTNG
ncbi:serine/threonine protein kinase [Mycobacterium sp. 1164966.3]|uniref:serine/threonine protein kinase n=1 Tax=Mycobacterium sp. 1164966.3 TaxID=1856861 RepID=UPI0007FD905E|nr:serine/threonine protein kinase [Mycobacterium sp. 1164966.3]OBA80488.1 serine/threonine protein kinase [Mycobacterium sp. 1164966.3]